MIKLRNILTISMLSICLIACSGTGTRNLSEVIPVIDQSGESKIFVLRKTGYICSACLMNVVLNGEKIGRIGTSEMVVGVPKPGNNALEVNIGGIQGVGLNKPIVNFNFKKGTNRFYLVKMKAGLVSNKLILEEISKASWKNIAG